MNVSIGIRKNRASCNVRAMSLYMLAIKIRTSWNSIEDEMRVKAFIKRLNPKETAVHGYWKAM